MRSVILRPLQRCLWVRKRGHRQGIEENARLSSCDRRFGFSRCGRLGWGDSLGSTTEPKHQESESVEVRIHPIAQQGTQHQIPTEQHGGQESGREASSDHPDTQHCRQDAGPSEESPSGRSGIAQNEAQCFDRFPTPSATHRRHSVEAQASNGTSQTQQVQPQSGLLASEPGAWREQTVHRSFSGEVRASGITTPSRFASGAASRPRGLFCFPGSRPDLRRPA